MLSKPVPAWILLGAFVLTTIAGSINAVGFMGLHHQALSHMSGTATILSTDLSTGKYGAALHAGLVLLFFFFGCVLSGVIIRRQTLQIGPRYGIALIIESALLFAAAGLLLQSNYYGDYLAAMACGLQNAMATTYSGAIIRSTHITGIVTDLGLACGHFFRGDRIAHRQVTIHLILVAGFIFGGILGGLAFQGVGVSALLFPAAFTGLTGTGYAIYRQIKKAKPTEAD